MSQANVEAFYAHVTKNPTLLAKLSDGAPTKEEFISRAIAAAAEQGLSITHDEAKTWIDSQIAANKSGELSDNQLEVVAGGKSSHNLHNLNLLN